MIKNMDTLLSHGRKEAREKALDIVTHALKACDPLSATRRFVRIDGSRLLVGMEVLRFEDGIVPVELREVAVDLGAGYQDLAGEADFLVERLQRQLEATGLSTVKRPAAKPRAACTVTAAKPMHADCGRRPWRSTRESVPCRASTRP